MKKSKKTTRAYCNESADFNVKVIPGSRKVKVEGLPFTLELRHIISGSATRFWIKKYWLKEFNQVKTEPIPLDNIALLTGNYIYFGEIKKFRGEDGVRLFLMGPDKLY